MVTCLDDSLSHQHGLIFYQAVQYWLIGVSERAKQMSVCMENIKLFVCILSLYTLLPFSSLLFFRKIAALYFNKIF